MADRIKTDIEFIRDILKLRLDELRLNTKGDFQEGYDRGYAVCIKDIERNIDELGNLKKESIRKYIEDKI